jgi:hypothetical protein
VNGARRIFSYNWPTYVATWLAAIAVAVLAPRLAMRSPEAWLLRALGAGAVSWSLLSLVVSHYVYDRSELRSGAWVARLLPARVERWATIDAGLDAEVVLDGVLPGRCQARLDIYDGDLVRAPSVRRARKLTPRTHPATPAPATALPLGDASCELVAVIFTAHELRAPAAREAFFAELHRVLTAGGRVLLVEHVRDVANFLAFGPGFLHFASRRQWLRLADHAGLTVAVETRVTAWVMALALEKRA